MCQVETLIAQYDVSPEIYSIVGRLWFRYLETRRRGANKLENSALGKRKRKPKRKKRRRAIRRSNFGIPPEDVVFHDDEEEEEEEREDNENDAQPTESQAASNTFTTHEDLEAWLEGIGAIKSQKKKPSSEDEEEEEEEEEREKEAEEEEEEEGEEEEEEESEGTKENDTNVNSEGEELGGDRFAYELMDVHLETEGLPSMSLSLCICFVACMLMREPLLLSDLLR